MAEDPTLTIVGNMVRDAELRFTPGGDAVANLTVAQTPRKFNKTTSDWEDGETLFLRCNIWREMAENVTESCTTGTRVVVVGRLKSRSWDDKDSGQKRTVMELDVDEIGPSLRYATAVVTKTQKGAGGQQSGGKPARASKGSNGGGWSGSAGESPAGAWGAPAASAGQANPWG